MSQCRESVCYEENQRVRDEVVNYVTDRVFDQVWNAIRNELNAKISYDI